MKATQNISLVLIGIIFSAFVANNSIVGTWQLVKIFDVQNEEESFRPANYSSQKLTFQFTDNRSEGTLSGFTTSNNVTGKYSLSGSKITLNQFGGTKICENGWGSEIWEQLSGMKSFYYKNDSLIISTQNNEIHLFFIPLEISQ